MCLEELIKCLGLLGILSPVPIDLSYAIDRLIAPLWSEFVGSAVERKCFGLLLLNEQAVPHAA